MYAGFADVDFFAVVSFNQAKTVAAAVFIPLLCCAALFQAKELKANSITETTVRGLSSPSHVANLHLASNTVIEKLPDVGASIAEEEPRDEKEPGFENNTEWDFDDETGWSFALGIGAAGLQNVTAKGDEIGSNRGYQVSSLYQPMLGFTLSYNFFTWPERRFAILASVAAHWRDFADTAEYANSDLSKSRLDNNDISLLKILGELKVYWKPAPAGLGLIGRAGDGQFVVLESNPEQRPALVEVSTFAYGAGVDYHFAIEPVNLWGVYAIVESQQATSSTDADFNGRLSDKIDMGPAYELGLEWIIGERTSAQLYYGSAKASVDTYDLDQREVGLKFNFNFIATFNNPIG